MMTSNSLALGCHIQTPETINAAGDYSSMLRDACGRSPILTVCFDFPSCQF